MANKSVCKDTNVIWWEYKLIQPIRIKSFIHNQRKKAIQQKLITILQVKYCLLILKENCQTGLLKIAWNKLSQFKSTLGILPKYSITIHNIKVNIVENKWIFVKCGNIEPPKYMQENNHQYKELMLNI